MSLISTYRTKLERKKGERQQIQHSIRALRTQIKGTRKELRHLEQAREIIREVGLQTQQQLQYHIGDIASLALESVFPDPYELVVEFVQRRNKTECDLYFSRNEQRISPLDASGGGAVDVAAFALRIASWSMQTPRSRNIIILDEPFGFVSDDLQEKASQMIKELSERLGLQFLIVTHKDILTAYADKVFSVTKQSKDRPSLVKTM